MSRSQGYWLLLVLAVVVMVAPLWLFDSIPMTDLPCHAARGYILRHYQESSYFQNIFALSLEPMPNLAVDLILPALNFVFDAVTSARIFLTLNVLLFAFAVHRLSWVAFRSHHLGVPFAATFLYSSYFLAGFMSYCLASAAALAVFSYWWEWLESPKIWRTIVLAIATLCVYIFHGFGYLILGFSIALLLALRVLAQRKVTYREIVAALPLIPAALVQLYPWTNKVQVGGIIWATLQKKIGGVLSFVLGYHYGWDAAALALGLLAVLLLLWKREKLEVCRPFLYVSALLFALALVWPQRMTVGGGLEVNGRFVPPAVALAVVGVRVSTRVAVLRTALALAVVACAVHFADVLVTWRSLSGEITALRRSMTVVRPQSRIVPILDFSGPPMRVKSVHAMAHLGSYALIENESIPSNFWARFGVQPLYFRHPQEWWPFEYWVDEMGFDPQLIEKVFAKYDYAITCNLNPADKAIVSVRARQIGAGELCQVWQLK